MIKRVGHQALIYRVALQRKIPILFTTSMERTIKKSAFMTKKDALDMVRLVTGFKNFPLFIHRFMEIGLSLPFQ